MYQVISTNVDTRGKPFVSTIEHTQAEIYATQWHPEGAQFWYDIWSFNQQPSTIRVSQYAANFLVGRLRMNNRSFPTPEDAFPHLVSRYPIGYHPADQYAGFYCLVESVPAPTYKSKAEAWETIGLLALIGLALSVAGNVFLYKFSSAAVKPEPRPKRESQRLVNEV